MQRFRLAALPPAPWRNGGGVTREIARGALDGATEWDWRLSVARIAHDGPFSTFPGIDRVATLLDGAVRLESAAQTLAWTAPGEAHGFAGETAFTARLDGGGARFFNVMARRGRLVATVVAHRTSLVLAPAQAVQHAVLVLNGCFAVETPAGTERLEAEDGLLCTGARPALRATLAAPTGCLVEVRLSVAMGANAPAS